MSTAQDRMESRKIFKARAAAAAKNKRKGGAHATLMKKVADGEEPLRRELAAVGLELRKHRMLGHYTVFGGVAGPIDWWPFGQRRSAVVKWTYARHADVDVAKMIELSGGAGGEEDAPAQRDFGTDEYLDRLAAMADRLQGLEAEVIALRARVAELEARAG